MKKHLINLSLAVAALCVTSYCVIDSNKTSSLSSLVLENIEALSDDPLETDIPGSGKQQYLKGEGWCCSSGTGGCCGTPC